MIRRTALRLAMTAALLGVTAFAGIVLSSLYPKSGSFVHDHDISIPTSSFAPDLRFMPSATSILVIPDGWTTLHDLASGRELRRLHDGIGAFSPDGKQLAQDRYNGPPDGDGTVSVGIIDFASEKLLRTLKGPARRGVASLAWSQDSRWLARGNCENSVDIWDLTRNDPPVNLLPDTMMDNMVQRLLFSRDGQSLISAETHSGVRIRTVGTWSVQSLWKLPRHDAHDQMVTSIALSPDSTLLAACGGYSWGSSAGSMTHGMIKVWRTSDWAEVWSTDLPSMAQSVAISPDNSYLVCSIWREALVWDLRRGRKLQTLDVCRNGDPGIAISPDGRLLATSSNKGVLTLWRKTP